MYTRDFLGGDTTGLNTQPWDCKYIYIQSTVMHFTKKLGTNSQGVDQAVPVENVHSRAFLNVMI